ncbi:tRNA-uridine aminocarboxypropyltransferase [Endozoicomonas ascidiicola]|uniref:tRNA-uridine aminocarboxypropyltransferase n=1 Tax=Endozoicomonas ascidiicola TaxID=1698521 RepID=UPI000A867B56|nr:tRNA-uridine aminocarboxypropyltransferase [Endozoicomonas ascidiicola]
MPRAQCSRCHRPIDYCYCKHLQETTARIDLIILQHPSESRHALNTARIAALSIRNCQILIGEKFSDHPVLQERLATQSCCLLFPTEQATRANTLLSSATPPECCIVIDGTWRKARKIFYCNPALHTLPAMTLEPVQLSEYRIRKSS